MSKQPGLIIFFFALLLKIPFGAIAQDDEHQTGNILSANVNMEINDLWRLNTKLETRNYFYEYHPVEGSKELNHNRVDGEFIFTRKTGFTTAGGAGVLLRYENETPEIRLIQQFTMTSTINDLRIGHRIRLDQTFVPDSPVEHRFRYRISGDTPLQGENLDRGELYFKWSHEYLPSLSDQIVDLEIRTAVSLGYMINKKQKLESGIENRSGDLLDEISTFQYWWNIGWYYHL